MIIDPNPIDRRRMAPAVRATATMIHIDALNRDPEHTADVRTCTPCTLLAENIIRRLIHTDVRPEHANATVQDVEKPLAILTYGTMITVEVGSMLPTGQQPVNLYLHGSIPTTLAAMVLNDIAYNMLTAQAIND